MIYFITAFDSYFYAFIHTHTPSGLLAYLMPLDYHLSTRCHAYTLHPSHAHRLQLYQFQRRQLQLYLTLFACIQIATLTGYRMTAIRGLTLFVCIQIATVPLRSPSTPTSFTAQCANLFNYWNLYTCDGCADGICVSSFNACECSNIFMLALGSHALPHRELPNLI